MQQAKEPALYGGPSLTPEPHSAQISSGGDAAAGLPLQDTVQGEGPEGDTKAPAPDADMHADDTEEQAAGGSDSEGGGPEEAEVDEATLPTEQLIERYELAYTNCFWCACASLTCMLALLRSVTGSGMRGTQRTSSSLSWASLWMMQCS